MARFYYPPPRLKSLFFSVEIYHYFLKILFNKTKESEILYKHRYNPFLYGVEGW